MIGQGTTLCKCPVCDTVVEILDMVALEVSCCGQAMAPLPVKDNCQEGSDTHLPTFEASEDGLRVTVGEKPHAMHQDHRIEWIELISGPVCLRRFLEPGQSPEATFGVQFLDDRVRARAYCNVHGLWESSLENQLLVLDPRAPALGRAGGNNVRHVRIPSSQRRNFSVERVRAAV